MYLGIDLGTSALKVILIDDDQKLLGEKNIPLGGKPSSNTIFGTLS